MAYPYVSTGHLPPPDRVRELVTEAHQRFATDRAGQVSQVYPALGRAGPDLFGLCVATTGGELIAAGDAGEGFTIMSVTKPFVFALAAEALGIDSARTTIGVNATGLPFNSLHAVEAGPGGRTNPMVNPGAIAATSWVPGRGPEAKWRTVHDGLSRFAGRELLLDNEVYASAAATNHRNRDLARLLAERGRLGCDPADALDVYTRQCCLTVTATDLAIMAATLADGGRNPVTRDQVTDDETCHATLAVMATAGLYETSGDWLYTVGLPGKSGIGGGMLTVSPGKGGLGSFAPRLDGAGNSVKGQSAARFLSRHLGLDLFASRARS